MKTIMVGAIGGYTWPQIELWCKSLILSGFKGEIHMLVYAEDPQTLMKLKDLGIRLHLCRLNNGEQLVVRRFKDLAVLCHTFAADDWIIFADVGDIVFQRNPQIFIDTYKTSVRMIAASEGVTFSGNSWTDKNLRESLPRLYEKMKDLQVYNAGSFAGEAAFVGSIAQKVFDISMALKAQKQDQVVFNQIIQLNKTLSAQILFVPPDYEWCHCAASSMFPGKHRSEYLGRKPMIRNGRCYCGSGNLAFMFHHYTRDRITTQQVRRWITVQWNQRKNEKTTP